MKILVFHLVLVLGRCTGTWWGFGGYRRDCVWNELLPTERPQQVVLALVEEQPRVSGGHPPAVLVPPRPFPDPGRGNVATTDLWNHLPLYTTTPPDQTDDTPCSTDTGTGTTTRGVGTLSLDVPVCSQSPPILADPTRGKETGSVS